MQYQQEPGKEYFTCYENCNAASGEINIPHFAHKSSAKHPQH